MSEENKKKGKELEHFIKEDNEELELLDWEKDKDIIITIMENLGFKQTKNKTLFVKDLQNGDSIFCEFKDDKLGKFWTKKGSNIHDINEYIAFRALQEGKGSISIEGGNCIINIEEEGKIFTIEIQKQYDIDDTVRKRMKDESFVIEQQDGKKITLNPDLLINIKGKLFPTIDAVVDAMHKSQLLEKWEIELVKIPEKVLPEKKSNFEEPEDIQSDKYLAVAKARITLKNGIIVESIGDAHPLSVSDYMRPHVIRMAETREIARALKFAGNLHSVMAEELKDIGGGLNEEPKIQ